jgi:hypothetical protein
VKKTSSSSDSPALWGLARLEDSAASEEAVIWDLGNLGDLLCAAATSISSLLDFGGVHTSVSYPNWRGEFKGVENLSTTKSIMNGISPDGLGDSTSFGVRIGDGGQSIVASKRKSEDVRVRRTCVEDNILSAIEWTSKEKVKMTVAVPSFSRSSAAFSDSMFTVANINHYCTHIHMASSRTAFYSFPSCTRDATSTSFLCTFSLFFNRQ